MRVHFTRPDLAALPASERFFVTPEQLFLTEGKTYAIHALSVYEGVTFVLVVDDKDTPIFRARSLFETDDSKVPSDWIVNVFQRGPVQMIMGPEFIAKDLASYEAMIDQREPQMRQLWKRIDAEKPSVDDENE